MKETKVYVDELPKSCFECLFMTDNQEGYDGCFCKLLDERAETKNRLKNCPLIDIKVHDRELVKEVCEKIARNVRVRKIQEEWYAIETDLRAILDQIQKEFENE